MYIQLYTDKRHLIYKNKHFATLDYFFGIFKQDWFPIDNAYLNLKNQCSLICSKHS